MVMGLLSPRGSQITATTGAGTGNAMADASAMLACLEFSFFDQGIGSGSGEPRISRVDVILLFHLFSSVVGSCSSV